MRDPARIERIGAKVIAAWALVPDWRLAQLVTNLSREKDSFYFEDDALERALDRMLQHAEDDGA